MTKALRVRAALALCLALLPLAPAAAQDLSEIAQVDVLPGWRLENGDHMSAIRIRMKPRWHTYWRAPGDAGVPPQFDFAGSDNLEAVRFHWPTPQVFWINGLASVGYEDQLILPMQVSLREDGAPGRLRAEIDLGVCEEICVPLTVAVSADLPAGSARPDARILAALADRPMNRAEAGAGAVTCEVGPLRDGLSLRAELDLPSLGTREFAVIELPDPDLWVSEAQFSRDGGQVSVQVEVAAMSGGTVAFDRQNMRLTVIGERGAVEVRGCG